MNNQFLLEHLRCIQDFPVQGLSRKTWGGYRPVQKAR